MNRWPIERDRQESRNGNQTTSPGNGIKDLRSPFRPSSPFCRTRIAIIFAIACATTAAFAQTSSDNVATVSIGTVDAKVGDTVPVTMTLATHGTQPALIMFRVSFNAATVAFKSVAPGASAIAAHKGVDASLAGAGVMSFIVWGLNTEVMADGDLMIATFDVLSADGEDVASLQGANASASGPAGEAVSVKVVDGAIQISCVGPEAPSGVTASQGRSDGVFVQWQAVAGAASYRVYRNTTDDSTTASPVSEWLPGLLSFLDVSAESTASAGCFAAASTYRYWVRAKNAGGCAGLFSPSAEGYRSGGKMLFQNVSKAGTDTPITQPAYADFDVSGMDLSQENNDRVIVSVSTAATFSVAPDAVSPIYVIGPDEVYETPQRVWLPLPSGVEASSVTVYASDLAGHWRPIDEVGAVSPKPPQIEDGFVPDSGLFLELNGRTYVGFVTRRGGLVQLGAAVAPNVAAGVVSGDLLILLGVCGMLLAIAAWKPSIAYRHSRHSHRYSREGGNPE